MEKAFLLAMYDLGPAISSLEESSLPGPAHSPETALDLGIKDLINTEGLLCQSTGHFSMQVFPFRNV